MDRETWKQSIYNRASTKYKVSCPYCNHRYYWTRPTKRSFEEFGSASIVCVQCNKLYWIEKTKNEQGLFVRSNREDKDG